MSSSIHDKIEEFFETLKEFFHDLAETAVAAAPVAEAVETIVAPEEIAPTEAAAKIAEAVKNATEDSSPHA